MKKAYTVLVDSREKRPLTFPAWLPVLGPKGRGRTVRIHTKSKRMETGDYAIEGYEDLVLVERKGSLRELAQNCCTPDRLRFKACLDRLRASCQFPHLLVEGTPSSLLSDRALERPYLALDGLFRMLADAGGIPMMWLPNSTPGTRARIGEITLRLMLGYVLGVQR